MPRARMIKPGLVKNEVLAAKGAQAQLLFALLPCYADREGRLEDRPKRLKAEIFPYYEVDVESLLDFLATCEEQFICRYEIDGKRYIQITNFDSHQSPHHKETQSTIQACPNNKPCMSQPRHEHDNLEGHAPIQVTSNKYQGLSNKLEVEAKFLEKCKSLEGFRTPRGDQLSGKRRQAFMARLDSTVGDVPWFEAFCEACDKFPLLCTKREGGWKPDVEWILRPDSVQGILEGKYDWSPQPNGSSQAYDRESVLEEADRIVEEALGGQ